MLSKGIYPISSSMYYLVNEPLLLKLRVGKRAVMSNACPTNYMPLSLKVAVCTSSVRMRQVKSTSVAHGEFVQVV